MQMNEEKLDRLLAELKGLPGYEDIDIERVKEVLNRGRGRKPAKAFSVKDFDAVEKRIMSIAAVDTKADLYRVLVTAPLTYSRAREKKEVPASWLWALVWSYSVNPWWVLYGERNPKYLAVSDQPLMDRVREV